MTMEGVIAGQLVLATVALMRLVALEQQLLVVVVVVSVARATVVQVW